MKFENYFWPDSQLEKMQIEYDHASLVIWNDVLERELVVECYGLAGITNLCIWDDTIIWSAEVRPVCNSEDAFVRNLYTAYDKNYDYGGRFLSNGLLELRIELVNHIAFSVYCQRIEVVEKTGDGLREPS